MSSVEVRGISAIAGQCSAKEELFRDCVQSRTSVIENGTAPIPPTRIDLWKNQTPESLNHSRSSIVAFQAMTQAIADSGWTAAETSDCGFIFATTTGQIDQWEDILPTADPQTLNSQLCEQALQGQSLGRSALQLKTHFKISGPSATVVSSCGASLQALALARLWIKTGRVQRCIIGTVEIISQLTQVGFGSLRLLSSKPCRPFDRDRSGINLGEGSAFLCLQASDQKKSDRWGFLTGGGMASDGYHPTAPHPEGEGSQRAIQAALKDAKLAASDIDWVYAHGTGSTANDSAELSAVRKVVGHPFVASTKGIHGHTLAASGCIEAALGLMAMKENLILPTAGFSEGDGDLRISAASRPHNIRHFVKNSLGFGGINVALVFSKEVTA